MYKYIRIKKEDYDEFINRNKKFEFRTMYSGDIEEFLFVHEQDALCLDKNSLISNRHFYQRDEKILSKKYDLIWREYVDKVYENVEDYMTMEDIRDEVNNTVRKFVYGFIKKTLNHTKFYSDLENNYVNILDMEIHEDERQITDIEASMDHRISESIFEEDVITVYRDSVLKHYNILFKVDDDKIAITNCNYKLSRDYDTEDIIIIDSMYAIECTDKDMNEMLEDYNNYNSTEILEDIATLYILYDELNGSFYI